MDNELKKAVDIIEKINKLWQEGITDITPSVNNTLIESIAIIEKHLPSDNQNLNDLFLIGRYLLNNATIIKSNKFKNSDDLIDSIIDQLA